MCACECACVRACVRGGVQGGCTRPKCDCCLYSTAMRYGVITELLLVFVRNISMQQSTDSPSDILPHCNPMSQHQEADTEWLRSAPGPTTEATASASASGSDPRKILLTYNYGTRFTGDSANLQLWDKVHGRFC